MTSLDAEKAKRICTQRELDVLWLHIAGIGRRRGAVMLGISEDAWRHRLNSAHRKLTIDRKDAA